MENQKIITFSDYTPNHSCKFRPKKWVETGEESHWMYDVNYITWFKTASLDDYTDTYIHFKGSQQSQKLEQQQPQIMLIKK